MGVCRCESSTLARGYKSALQSLVGVYYCHMPTWYDILFQNTAAIFGGYEYAIAGGALIAIIVHFLMRPRRIYFVRHGETAANAERIRQQEGGGLSPLGRLQAQAASEYLAPFPIRAMISSPYERAVETAQIINERLKVPLTFSPLLIERRNPSEIVGKNDDTPEVRRVVDQIDRVYHEDDFRYSDEENFADLKTRARRCLNLLARQSTQHTCVVTHSIFLKMLTAYLLYREGLHASDYAKLSFYNASDNAGITICEFNPWKMLGRTRGWSVIEYNVTPYESLAAAPNAPPRIPAPIS